MNGTEIFRIERREETVIVWIDDPRKSVNTIGEAFVTQLDALLDDLEGDHSARGIVFSSGKPDFLLGADLEMLRGKRSAAEGEAISRRTQAVFERIACLATPTAAAIRGKCLGGGLEFALACDMRVASGHRSCKLGQTEIKFGLLPGAGGTQRLPRTVGLARGLELMLRGTTISSEQAFDDGLVDLIVPEPIVLDVARKRVAEAELASARARSEGPGKPGKDEGAGIKGLVSDVARGESSGWSALSDLSLVRRLRSLVLEDNPIGRRLVFEQARKRAQAKTHGNMPAVDRIIDVVKTGLRADMEAGLQAEARAFGELQASPESRELVRLFFVARELDHESGFDHVTGETEIEARTLDRIGIIGGGVMGSGIAYVSAAVGLRVRLQDKGANELCTGLARIHDIVERRGERGEYTAFERRVMMARVGPTLRIEDLRTCPLVIEAAYEDLALKRELLANCEALGREDLIFASNTSAIPISRIAEGCSRPQNVIGMHYFSPVETMPLLEIVATEQTSAEVIATCSAVGTRQGKTVIVVNDGVGFYTTRILAAYVGEAFALLGRGAPVDAVDQALLRWGFAMGPFALADQVGIGLAAKIGELMTELGDRFEIPPSLTRLVENGFTGRAGEGLYERDGGDPNPRVQTTLRESLGVEQNPALMAREDLALRCVLRMIDEAVRCLDEGILHSARDGDAGAVFGVGYPAVRGGPFRTIKTIGAARIRDQMVRLGLPVSAAIETMARERVDTVAELPSHARAI